jgi:hypothetical protein
MKFGPYCAMLLTVFSLVGASARAGTILTVSGAGVQQTSICTNCTETFDDETVGLTSSVSLEFGTGAGVITGTLSTTGITGANRMAVASTTITAQKKVGGAGGTGNFLEGPLNAARTTPMTLTLSQPVNYLGLWLSAIDGFNEISFYSGTTLLQSFTIANVCATDPSSAYCGNPNVTGTATQRNTGEAYEYLNFTGTAGTTFTSVQFVQTAAQKGFEMDNISVANLAPPQPPKETPEPGTSAAIAGGLIVMAGLGRRVMRQRR